MPRVYIPTIDPENRTTVWYSVFAAAYVKGDDTESCIRVADEAVKSLEYHDDEVQQELLSCHD